MAGDLAVIFLTMRGILEKLSNLLRRKMSKISVFMPKSSVFLRWFAYKIAHSKHQGAPVQERAQGSSHFALKSLYLVRGRGEGLTAIVREKKV
ncbi:hypothetical protein [Haemophilus influenzae]|uniref:hypothetical protein n=1 Tax=Haemophilus influenzae TaxID=727 RepID=UPI0010A2D835|nr:hypothetical protein [Haemophilus influenzae]